MVETELPLNLDRRAGFVTGHVTMGRRHCREAGAGEGQEMLILILPAMSENPFANSVNDIMLFLFHDIASASRP